MGGGNYIVVYQHNTTTFHTICHNFPYYGRYNSKNNAYKLF